jgi:flagellar biosynthesis GTPase FlhF
MVIKDIKDLDDPAQRLKVMWEKANNFFRNFTLEYIPIREALVKGEYGSDWLNIDRWMLTKVGISDRTVLDVIDAFKRSYAHDEQEKLESLRKEQAAAKRREKETKELEAAKRRQERAAEQLAKNAIAEDARKSQAAWDGMRAEMKAAEDAQKKKDAKNKKRRKPKGKKSPGKSSTTKKNAPVAAHPNGNGSVTNGVAVLLGLAKELRALRKRDVKVRENWVLVTLAKAEALAKVKKQIPDKIAFGKWLTDNGFDTWLNDHDRAALINFGSNIELARTVLLEHPTSWSVQHIWEKEKNRFAQVSKTPLESDFPEEHQGDTLH